MLTWKYPRELPDVAASAVLPAGTGTSLLSILALVPANFVAGVEILSDNSTSVEFVVDTLQTHLGLDYSAAVRSMLDIHKRDGALFPTANISEGHRIAEAMTTHAASRGYSLVRRPVTVTPQASTAAPPDTPGGEH